MAHRLLFVVAMALTATALGCGDKDSGPGEDTHEPEDPCGNGVIDNAEECDGENLTKETCEDQGFDGGDLACNSTCDGYDTSGCTLDFECTSDESGDERCTEDVLETCDGSEWSTTQDCAATGEICTTGEPGEASCELDTSCGADESGFQRCNEDVVETCNGEAWEQYEDCAAEGQVCESPGVGVASCV